jgi:hypothetical protein
MQKLKNGLIVIPVPKDAEDFQVNIWSDNSTTLEFKSETYEMEYDSFEIGVDQENQLKEITLFFEPIKCEILGTITKDSCDFDLSLIYSDVKDCNSNECFNWVKKQIESETDYLFDNPLGKIPKKAAILIGGMELLVKESYAARVNKVRYGNWQAAQDRVIEKLVIIKEI